jgi:hypothetical protein
MVPMPGRADGETAVAATGLLAGMLEFSFEGFIKDGREQGIQWRVQALPAGGLGFIPHSRDCNASGSDTIRRCLKG